MKLPVINMYNSAAIQGLPAKGYTTAEAIEAVREVAKETFQKVMILLGKDFLMTKLSRGNESIYIFLIVLVFVYFVLAAQYESFIIPLAVILSLPVGVFGSFLLLQVMGLAK